MPLRVYISVALLALGPAATVQPAAAGSGMFRTHAAQPRADLHRTWATVARGRHRRRPAVRFSGIHPGGRANGIAPELRSAGGFAAAQPSGTITASTPNEWGNFGGPNAGGGNGSP